LVGPITTVVGFVIAGRSQADCGATPDAPGSDGGDTLEEEGEAGPGEALSTGGSVDAEGAEEAQQKPSGAGFVDFLPGGGLAFALRCFFLGLHTFFGDGRFGRPSRFGCGLHRAVGRRAGRLAAVGVAPIGLAIAREAPPTTADAPQMSRDRIAILPTRLVRTPLRRLVRRCV
jgi:hypothetical protein